jgi:predicted RecB family nuclease
MKAAVMDETALSAVEGWNADHLARLEDVGITTAEQVVAVSATAGGLRSIAAQLEVSIEDARHLVNVARASLPDEVLSELEQPADTSGYGLGVLPPEGEDDRDP